MEGLVQIQNLAGTNFTEFYKQAVYHVVVSAVCAILFTLGLEYSQGSDGDNSMPYFVPAMVLSTLHFILTIIALLTCYCARALSDIYDTLRRWDNSEEHFRNLKSLYLVLQYPCVLWTVVGAALTGNAGICSNAENPCYYTVNDWDNRGIAIAIIIIHIINGVLSFVTLTTRHKIRREKDIDLGTLQKRSRLPQEISLSSKPPNFNAKNNKHTDHESPKKDIGKTLPPIKEPQPLKKHISTISTGPIFDANDTNRRNVLPSLKQPLKRHHTVHNGSSRSADDTSLKRRETIQNEANGSSVPSTKIDKKIKRVISKVNIVPPKNRHASFVQSKNKALYKESDESSSSSDDSSIRRLPKSDKKRGVPPRRMSENPKVPPPSYRQALASSDREPYQLPPLPQHDPSMHYVPQNMYTGYSYPETDIDPVQPLEVPKARWKIRQI